MGFIHIGAFQLTIDGNDDRKGYGRFRRRDGDDENDENRTRQAPLSPKLREGEKIDVDRVEHQLDSHQDRNGVFARQDPKKAYSEQEGGKIEKMNDRDLVHEGSFRATTTAPTKAESKRMETNSKAKAKPFWGFNSAAPRAATSFA